MLLPTLLTIQGVMGGIDTLLNHELIERLPHRLEARREVGLHSIREAIYAALFGGLAWFEWHGATTLFIAALLVGEVVVTACDEFIENRIRVLPQNERVLHVFLTLNFGLVIAALVPILSAWSDQPTALVITEHGALSWVLTLLSFIGISWSIRDVIAWRRLAKSYQHTQQNASAE